MKMYMQNVFKDVFFLFSSAETCCCLFFSIQPKLQTKQWLQGELNQMQKIKVHKNAITLWASCCLLVLFLLLSSIWPFHTWIGFQSISILSVHIFYTLFFYFVSYECNNECLSPLSAIISLWLLLINSIAMAIVFIYSAILFAVH